MELVTKSKTSVIDIGEAILDNAGHICKSLIKSGKVAVITDSNVAPLYAVRVCGSIKKAGLCPALFIIPAGEEYKNLNTVSEIYNFLAENLFTRSDLLLALGGGVTGDIAGFVSATYLRGINSVQVPTTLVAQVDSSVGGKCGVDLPAGKNLIGAFNQPDYVIIDTSLLKTLPDNIFNDGMAEVVKYGCIFDKDLFELLESNNPRDFITEIVKTCVGHKADVVKKDERDTGERMKLNFGHTVGHAIEKAGNYTSHTHGQAVAAGMVYEARIGEILGITPKGTSERITALIKRFGFETRLPCPAGEVLDAIKADKKILDGRLNLILLRDIGASVIHPITLRELKSVMVV